MADTILGTERVGRLFMKYTVPTVIAMLLLGINTIIDGLFLGNYIGANALASVNIALPVSSLMLAVGVVIGIGTQSMIGRCLGAGQTTEANQVFQTSLLLTGGISLLFVVVTLFFPAEIARLLGANERLLPQTTTYIQYVGVFLPCLAFMLVLDYVLKALAQPVYAMICLLVAVSSHVCFNWLLVAAGGWGIRGAALAMGIGYTVAFVMAVLPFLRQKTVLTLRGSRFDRQLAVQILYSGSSEGLSEVGTAFTTFLFNITLMRYVGEIGVAAFTLIGYLAFVGNNVLLGLSDGVAAIISYNYGSRQWKRVKAVLQMTLCLVFAIGVIFFVSISRYSYDIIGLFLESGHEQIQVFAVYGAGIYAFAFLVNGFNIVAAGYFTAIGRPQQALIIAVSKGIVWIAIGLILFPLVLGIEGIWLTVPVAEALTVFISIIFLYRNVRQLMHSEVCSH